MDWLILLALLFVFFIGLMVVYRLRERRYLKKKTSEALGGDMKFEIDREKTDWQRRHHKFEKALGRERAKKK